MCVFLQLYSKKYVKAIILKGLERYICIPDFLVDESTFLEVEIFKESRYERSSRQNTTFL